MRAYGCISWFVHAIHSRTVEFPRISLLKQKRKHELQRKAFLCCDTPNMSVQWPSSIVSFHKEGNFEYHYISQSNGKFKTTLPIYLFVCFQKEPPKNE